MKPRAGIQDLKVIAAQLRELLESSPRSEDAVVPWTATALATYKRLQEEYPDVQWPIQVLHFVHDADIRARDPEYRKIQEDEMRDIVWELTQGRTPRTSGFSVSFSIRQAGLFLSILALTIFFLVHSCTK